MITLQSILEQDKERLISRISGVENQTVVKEVREELSRMLFSFNDRETEPEVREAAGHMIAAVQSAAGMMDAKGDTKIYGRTEYGGEGTGGKKKRSFLFRIFLFAGLLCAIAMIASVYPALADAGRYPRRMLLAGTVLAALLLFLAGRSLHHPGVTKKGEELYAEVGLDPARIYMELFAATLVIDKNIEAVRSEQRTKRRREQEHKGGGISREELELMARLLEDAYGRRGENEWAEELCSQLKYYLHGKQIEVVDYEMKSSAGTKESAGHADWFDRIPAYGGGTIRPALVMDGVLLKKGLASNG